MIKPRKLSKGDKVAIISLSSGILGEESVSHQKELGIKRLNDMGLEVIFTKNALKGLDYIKNNPKERANDLIEAFLNKEVKAIISAIGGDDTYKIIPYLMEDDTFKSIVLNNPKIFIGFSDTTNNHIMLNKIGLVTYYGLNFLSDICELSEEMLPFTKKNYNLFFTNHKELELKPSNTWYLNRISYDLEQLKKPLKEIKSTRGYEVLNGKGIIEGILFGGCLESIYDIYTGSRYGDERIVYDKYGLLPSSDFYNDKILFLETSEEKVKPKEFLKMILALIKEKVLTNVKAIIIGKPYDEIYYDEYKDILIKVAKKYNLSVMYNINFGHALPRGMLPYGVKASINFDLKEIKVIEKMFEGD